MRRLETLAADSATLQAYLQEIAKFPRLALEQERELGRRIREHDDDALHALVQANLRFVATFARRYRRLGVPVLDLIHEGNLGMFEAARVFDPDRHGRFVAHAAWWMRENILRRLSEAQGVTAFVPGIREIPSDGAASDGERWETHQQLLSFVAPARPGRRGQGWSRQQVSRVRRFEAERLQELRRRHHLRGSLN